MSRPVPKVAVITRTKDRGILLERAIKSIHTQTMPDFIHVIINDAGKPKAVENLVKKHKNIIKGRVKIIHNDKSSGMESASNQAIKSVDSIFVTVHDDDDSWHPDFLKKTTKHLEATGAKGVTVKIDKVIEKLSSGKVVFISQEPLHPQIKNINLYEMCLTNYVSPISFLYRREVFDDIGYYDESLKSTGDWDFTLRFLLRYDIEFLDSEEPLAFYHHRPDSTGSEANMVYQGTHKRYKNMVANKHLRNDINSGRAGLGYIMNTLRHEHKREQQINEQIGHLANMFTDISSRLKQLERLAASSEQPSKSRFLSLPKRVAGKIRHKKHSTP